MVSKQDCRHEEFGGGQAGVMNFLAGEREELDGGEETERKKMTLVSRYIIHNRNVELHQLLLDLIAQAAKCPNAWRGAGGRWSVAASCCVSLDADLMMIDYNPIFSYFIPIPKTISRISKNQS